MRAGQKNTFPAVPPPQQDFSALSGVSVAGWACHGEGVSDWEANASVPLLWAVGDILGHLAAMVVDNRCPHSDLCDLGQIISPFRALVPLPKKTDSN